MNILTFDIEEWYLEKYFFGNLPEKYKNYDHYLGEILDTLDKTNQKGTFFCVGGLGRDFPHVVKRIAERGHDVGCHSNIHTWLNKMTRQECFDDTRNAVDLLEQCIGKKIKSYRAPAFSIGASNKWAFEVLAECGIERDASVFPAVRDFGGFAEFGQKVPSVIRYNGIELKEFPICTAKVLNKEIAYSGGGYFRFFPLWYVKNIMSKSEYSMMYFHIADLVTLINGVMSKEEYEEYFKEPGTFKNRYLRYIKTNLGMSGAFAKLQRLISTASFMNLEEANDKIDWSKSPIIEF